MKKLLIGALFLSTTCLGKGLLDSSDEYIKNIPELGVWKVHEEKTFIEAGIKNGEDLYCYVSNHHIVAKSGLEYEILLSNGVYVAGTSTKVKNVTNGIFKKACIQELKSLDISSLKISEKLKGVIHNL